MARHEAIEVAGATLRHLPLNPNRPVLLKLKALLRKVVERSIEVLRDRVGELLDAFSPEECANYFRYDRYRTN
jgi:hypothetical protein